MAFIIPSFQRLFAKGFDIPWWFQLVVGTLPIPLTIKMALEASYVIWRDLPWFHKNGALIELRKACLTTRDGYKHRPEELPPAIELELNKWCQQWNPLTKAKRAPKQEHV